MAIMISEGRCVEGEKVKIAGMRRADKFSKMAVKAAKEALEGVAVAFEPTRVGVILSTQFGPHSTTFKFLDDVIDFESAQVSPTVFSHSVHNAAASYIAMALALRGPTSTVTTLQRPFDSALQLAEVWLNAGMVDLILVGYVEEKSAVFEALENVVDFPSYSAKGLKEGAYFRVLTAGDSGTKTSSIESPLEVTCD